MKALITGITGQDGSYLADMLLEKNYEVYGIHRRSSTNTFDRISHIVSDRFHLVEGDITDPTSMREIVRDVQPDELYHTAAQSHVATSFKQPTTTWNTNATGTLNVLEAIRHESPHTRLLNCATSEMFGSNFDDKEGKKIQSINTPFHPRSPYAVSKVAAYDLVRNYRDAYGLHAQSAITFNHGSPRRGENFVTRKITKWIGEFDRWIDQEFYTVLPLFFIPHDHIYYGDPVRENSPKTFPKLRLGNLKAYRDWSHAKDVVEAFYLMLQRDTPKDYVISSGETYSIEDFLAAAFLEIGIENWKDYIVIDPAFYRPAEVEYLLGDSTPIREELGWKPKYDFKGLVKEMVRCDLEAAKT